MTKASTSLLNTWRDERKVLNNAIEIEVKSLCSDLVQNSKDSGKYKNDGTLSQITESQNENLKTLLVSEKVNHATSLNQNAKDLMKLSSKIQLIFNTLLSIANNLEESSLEECLQKASNVVMSQINALINDDEERTESILKYVKKTEDEKQKLASDNEDLRKFMKQHEQARKDMSHKLTHASKQLESISEKGSYADQLEAEIEELNAMLNEKDSQCKEMVEVIEHLERLVEQEVNKNNELNQNLEDLHQEYEEVNNVLDEKCRLISELEKFKEAKQFKTSEEAEEQAKE